MKYKIISILIAIIIVVGALPISVSAKTGDMFYGVDVRVQSVSPDLAIKDAKLLVQISTRINADLYKPAEDVNVARKWYAYQTSNASVSEGYVPFTYPDGSEIYIKEITDESQHFDLNTHYVCFVTLTSLHNEVFSVNCRYSPQIVGQKNGSFIPGVRLISDSNHEVVLAMEVVPDAEIQTIEAVDASLELFLTSTMYTATLHLPNSGQGYEYMYVTSDGTYDEASIPTIGDAVGTFVINKQELHAGLTGTERLKLNPDNTFMRIYKVRSGEWVNETVCVYGYGEAVLPVDHPYLFVDEIIPGVPITVKGFASEFNGRYSENIANASFVGWFADDAGTIEWTNEADAYAIFDVYAKDGFKNTQYGNEYTIDNELFQIHGHKLTEISDTESRIAFKVSTQRAAVTVTTSGGTGQEKAWFEDTQQPEITLVPNDEGKMITLLHVEFPAEVYVKRITFNDIEWTDTRNPYIPRPNSTIWISNNEIRKGDFYVPISEDTNINIEFAYCDVITIDYGNALVDTKNLTEQTRHPNHKYYAPENINVFLCPIGYYYQINPVNMDVRDLNTDPNGKGYSLQKDYTLGYFQWKGIDEYRNGQKDEITLYVRLICGAHVADNISDEDYFEYFPETGASCGQQGHIAYRHCKYCGLYQVLQNNKYVEADKDEIFVNALAHNYEYTTNHHGSHIAVCTRCGDTFTEEHQYVKGVCTLCGAIEEDEVPKYIIGDLDGDEVVTDADAVYLLYYTIFGAEDFPINQPADYDGDGNTTDADAVYLLYYTIFGEEDFPLNS